MKRHPRTRLLIAKPKGRDKNFTALCAASFELLASQVLSPAHAHYASVALVKAWWTASESGDPILIHKALSLVHTALSRGIVTVEKFVGFVGPQDNPLLSSVLGDTKVNDSTIATIVGDVKLSFKINASMTATLAAHDPPERAEYLLALITPMGRNEEFAGDLFEKYQRVCAKHGVRKANFYYWWQVVRSVPGMFDIRIRSLTILGGITRVYHELLKYLSDR